MRAPTTLPTLRRVALALLLTCAGASSASAQPAKPPAAKPAAKTDVGPAVQKLKSGDEAQIRAGLDDLRIVGPAAASAAPAVADILARGLSEPLAHQAIDTLGDLEASDGSAILAQYAQHRTVAIRRAAIKALTRTKGPAAATALRKALGDSDAQVRGNAAAGLGALKAKDAVPDLFAALDHKVNEAAASIGQLCNAEQCDQLAGKLGKLPFDVVTSGLEPVLFRPASDMSDDAKIKLLGRLRELGTGEANRFLKDVEKRLPKEASPRIRQAVEQAVKATTGGSQ
ncbi:MAG: HEAT repeat domain-containing protein [Labilithrix sp.]|nr:HEAT repeat domain-containing protein [Labilithrix sp.]MBX3222512.1 HEAT repeat domain-containing protein [Labilithrix sp.]